MKTPVIVACVLVCLVMAAAAADFSKGDRVELVKDVPLYFKEFVSRVGKRGERYVVLAVRPEDHRVFVLGHDDRGHDIALGVAEDAVALVGAPAPAAPVGPAGNAEVADVPALLAGRVSAQARTRAMAMNGGKASSDEAVVRGLRFLVKTQNPDGSWGKGNKSYVAAMTGFSLLSFLGHGETATSPEYGPTVKKTVEWIVEQGTKNQGRLSMEPAFSQAGVYAHAIATFALAEYYSMTKDESVVNLLSTAVAYIVNGQGPDGGWMYAYDKTEGDTSVSGWQIQALKAAHVTGLNLADVDAALDKAMLNLKRVQGPKGGFGYRKKEDRYSLTGVGVYCTYVWKQEKDASVRDGTDFMMEQTKKMYPVEFLHERADLYAWYYNTLACAAMGGAAWQTWNRMFQDEIVKHQDPDGSWPPLKKGAPGGEIQADPEGVGPFYRTTLCVLMLESYYRYTWPAKR